MPYLSYLSVFCPAAPTENASIHGRANTPRETRARGSGAVQGLPACVVASTNRDRAPSLPPPLLSLPPSLSSPAFVIARDIYPTRDIRTHTHICIYMCVYTVTEGIKKVAKTFRKRDSSIEEIDCSRTGPESKGGRKTETKRNALGVDRRPRRERKS